MALLVDISRKQLDGYELLVPPRQSAAVRTAVSGVRSTLVTASLLAIRENGWETRYFAALPTRLHDPIRSLIASGWLSIELAMAHYEALDALGLTSGDIGRVAENVSQRTQKSFAATLLRASTEVGVSPWILFGRTPSIWERVFSGGDIAVWKAGPKEVYVEALECPLLETRYFRTAFVSYFRAFVLFVSKTVYATELTKLSGKRSIVFRVSWV